MPNFPDWLFNFTPRDAQDQPLEMLLIRDTQVSLASTGVSSGGYLVPQGKILMVGSCGVSATPGAAQTLIRSFVKAYYQDATQATPVWGRTLQTVAATACGDYEYNGLIIPQGYTIQASAIFSGGAAANNVQLCLSGVLIPRGNFQI